MPAGLHRVSARRDDGRKERYELDNSQWGFESNCFVCERTNERGLGIPFMHDPDRNVVTAAFTLDGAFSGVPSYGHGGVVRAIGGDLTSEAASYVTP